MELMLWILLGITAGWLASIILGTHATQGLVTDVILGTVGAVVGGLLLNLIGQPGLMGFNLYSISVATLGAIVLIWFGRMINSPAK